MNRGKKDKREDNESNAKARAEVKHGSVRALGVKLFVKADYLEDSGVHEESADLVSGGSPAVLLLPEANKIRTP